MRTSRIRRSGVRQYAAFLVASAVLPMLFVGFIYDRYARGLLDEFTAERVDARLIATASKIGSFMESRANQLGVLARHPAAPMLHASSDRASREMADLVRLEADHPDLYGILVFSEDGALVRVFMGQGASGPPYLGTPTILFDELARARFGDAEVLGPIPPRVGNSGSFLMRQPLNGGGSIALHVRLASVTELMGSPAESDHLKLVLRTPAGDFDPVARPPALRGSVTIGPEVMPGWRPCLVVDRETILRPFHDARVVLFFASALAGGTISLLLFRMAWRLQQRVDLLSEGTKLIAAGRFGHRVEISGNDEIAVLGRRFNRMADRLGRLVDRTVRMRRQAALGQFSTGIAHEVRNPLAALKTTVQAMARLERDPQRAALLADMEREVDRMARAMTAILTFGRPRPPVRMDVPVHEEVRQLLLLAEQDAAERSIQLVRGEGLECAVAVDPDHLRQILMNLLANALQSTPAGGRVTVQGRARGDALEIDVEDTGEGIPPDKLAQVFEPFFTTKPGGTGLGLAISRQLAELNDGELSLRSTVGAGTTATLTLPRGSAHHADHPHHR